MDNLKVTFRVGAVIVAVLVGILVLAGSVHASNVVVCPSGCEYNNIRQALEETNGSVTIHVYNGTFKESLILKNRILIGHDATIDSIEIMCCGTIRLKNSSISGFTIKTNPEAYGITIFDNNIVSNNTIIGGKFYKGIDINGANNTIENNTVRDCGRGMVLMTRSRNNTIVDNTVKDCVRGIVLMTGSEDNVIENNLIIELPPPTTTPAPTTLPPTTTPPPITSPPAMPKITVLANSIDYANAGGFFSFLGDIGIELNHSTASTFNQSKQESLIIILGGPDAPEGVGKIVQEILSEHEQNQIRAGNQTKFVKMDPWSLNPDQKVIVLAGSDRYQTMQAHEENRSEVSSEAAGL